MGLVRVRIRCMDLKRLIRDVPDFPQPGILFRDITPLLGNAEGLRAARMSVEYSLEYGESRLDIHEDAMSPGTRALIVDDLLATGGTALAAAKLVELIGGVVAGLIFAIELEALAGRPRLASYTVRSLVAYA